MALQITPKLENLAEVDVVIEAATENEILKLRIFQQLDNICKPEALLASNTSSISMTKIAGATKRDEQVVGMHFMNPLPMMKLVEVIRALQTSDAVYQQIEARHGASDGPADARGSDRSRHLLLGY